MLMLLLALRVWSAPNEMERLSVRTANCDIRIHVNAPEQYSGTRVLFHSTNRQWNGLCLSTSGTLGAQNCMHNFVGAIAVVEFKVKPRRVESGLCLKLRERVRTIDEDEQLTKGQPFETTIRITGGVASDIQLFGFDRERGFSGDKADASKPLNAYWRMYRQDLFIDDDTTPFLIVHWKHTTSSIRVIDAIPVGATRLEQSSARMNGKP
jgi:hypothetical protein